MRIVVVLLRQYGRVAIGSLCFGFGNHDVKTHRPKGTRASIRKMADTRKACAFLLCEFALVVRPMLRRLPG